MKTLKEAFFNIIEQIKDKEFKGHVLAIMDRCPNYITAIPSASTGKYHPNDEICPDGMIRHVNRVALVAQETLRRRTDSPGSDEDILLAGAVLHDSWKQGTEVNEEGMPTAKYTTKQHPVLIYETIMKYLDTSEQPISNNGKIKLTRLADVCLFHEGRWTIPESKEAWKKRNPEGKMDEHTQVLCKEMHDADYYASRRSIYQIMQENKDA